MAPEDAIHVHTRIQDRKNWHLQNALFHTRLLAELKNHRKITVSGGEKPSKYTGCVRQNENPTKFKIVKQPLLIQKQTIHQQKALDFSYLEPKGQGRGIIMRAWQCHRRQRVKNPPRTCKKSTKNAFRGEEAWHPLDNATPTFRMSNESWDQGLFADVSFVSVSAMVFSQSWIY